MCILCHHVCLYIVHVLVCVLCDAIKMCTVLTLFVTDESAHAQCTWQVPYCYSNYQTLLVDTGLAMTNNDDY